MIEVILRCGTLAYLTSRGANVLVGLRYNYPIVWHRSGSYRWDETQHALDIISAIPDWWNIQPTGPRYNELLIEKFVDRGMDRNSAYHACDEIRRHYREHVGRFVFGDIVFHELDNGHWSTETFDENGNFMIEHGFAMWVGEPMPKKTGKSIRFNGVVN